MIAPSPAARRLVAAVVENIGVPVLSYLVLTWLGWQPVWALVGGAGISVLVLALQYFRRREISTLGLLVLARFALSVAVALLTGDPRLELVKDFAITFVFAVVAAATLGSGQPLIARIRRDISPDRAVFDQHWNTDTGFRRLHRTLTLTWVAGLSVECAVAVAVIYTFPLTAAVVVTSVLSPACVFGLVSWTQYRAHRWTTKQPVSDSTSG